MYIYHTWLITLANATWNHQRWCIVNFYRDLRESHIFPQTVCPHWGFWAMASSSSSSTLSYIILPPTLFGISCRDNCILNLELLSSFSNLVSPIWFKNKGTSNIVNICEPNQSFNSSCLVEKIEAQIRVWASPLDKPQNCGTAPVVFSWFFTRNVEGPKGWGLKIQRVWNHPCQHGVTVCHSVHDEVQVGSLEYPALSGNEAYPKTGTWCGPRRDGWMHVCVCIYEIIAIPINLIWDVSKHGMPRLNLSIIIYNSISFKHRKIAYCQSNIPSNPHFWTNLNSIL
jgi:hypothetical protein